MKSSIVLAHIIRLPTQFLDLQNLLMRREGSEANLGIGNSTSCILEHVSDVENIPQEQRLTLLDVLTVAERTPLSRRICSVNTWKYV